MAMDAGGRRVGPANASAWCHVRLRATLLLSGAAVILSGCNRPERKLPLLPPPPAVRPVRTQPPPPKKEEPKVDPAAILFPRSPGDTWELSAKVDGQPYRLAMTITEVKKESPGRTTFTVETIRDGMLAQREMYYIDDKGIYRTASGEDGAMKIAPPIPMLTFPWKLGTTWQWSGVVGMGAPDAAHVEAKFKLSGPEELKTPAKSFLEVYRLDQTFTLPTPEGKQTWHNVQWLAPNIGLVKQVTDVGGQHTEAELVKYKVAGSDKKPADAGTTPSGNIP